jgi:hypothetical protein
MNVKVQSWVHVDGEMVLSQECFDCERQARKYINLLADGDTMFALWVNGECVIETRFPVLMVA